MADPVALDLTPEEVRVLGALVEKELSTPDYYPLTLNALVAACNQKSNREPVVDYGEGDVMAALDRLQRRRLGGTVSGAGSRVTKYRHALAETLGLDEAERTVLASLLLRGPQTVGEIRGRTGRMHAFGSMEEVEATLEALAARDEPLVRHLPRLPGQKEGRYVHLLAGEPDAEALQAEATPPGDRLTQLEDDVTSLREQLQALEDAFRTFRAQFE